MQPTLLTKYAEFYFYFSYFKNVLSILDKNAEMKFIYFYFLKPAAKHYLSLRNYNYSSSAKKTRTAMISSDMFCSPRSNFLWKYVYNFFFFFNFNANFYKKNVHPCYQLLFVASFQQHWLLNTSKIFYKWVNIFRFLQNLIFYQIKFVLCGNFVFKKELLAFNWNQNKFSINLWTYSFAFIFFKRSVNHEQIQFFLKRLEKNHMKFIFFLDIYYHYKNLFMAKKLNFFSIGVVPLNMNPWIVFYPIPVASNTFFIQYFVYKLLIIFKKIYSYQLIYCQKQLWKALR